MSKLSLSIDLCQLQGASIVTSKAGTPCLVINLPESRAKLYDKKDGNKAVYLKLEAVESDKLRNEDTHFVVEPTTKEERAEGVRLPIIGNGREYFPVTGEQQPQRQQQPPRRAPQREPEPEEPSFDDGTDGDDIPF